jgi:hypothetical protein
MQIMFPNIVVKHNADSKVDARMDCAEPHVQVKLED